MIDRVEEFKRQRTMAAAELVGWTQAILADASADEPLPPSVLQIAQRIVDEYTRANDALTAAIAEALAEALA